MKEATARIKINKLLEAAGWRFFPEGDAPANIRLEPSVTLKATDLDALGENFEKTTKGFVDFLLLDAKGFPLIVLEAKAEDKNPLVGKEQARKYARSLNMATPPGDFVLVVPAEDRKSADHWDFEGSAVCVPLVSSSGHGKADIKRLHYQDGKFALASTMCAIFTKNEELIRPRFLHLFLSEMCDDLLVPLMCGATNVTLDSRQLKDVVVPVPDLRIQDEVVESYLIRKTANEMAVAANRLRKASADANVVRITERVIRDVADFLNATKDRTTIARFLPN